MASDVREKIVAPRGIELQCKGWHQEAALRMLMNNLEQGADPDNLIIYGGTGRAARNWEAYEAIVRCLKNLENDETLLIQSGKPVGIFRTHAYAPRVLIANSLIVPHWDTDTTFDELDAQGLIMYGQMTAGSWIFIGQQGILQGTYETFAAAARTHFGGDLKGKFLLTGGLGNMGGAQALAATMNGAAFLGVEFRREIIERVIREGLCDRLCEDLDEALDIVLKAKKCGAAISVGLLGNTAETHPEILRRGVIPDLVTDQTSAHEPKRYWPKGMRRTEAERLLETNPEVYVDRAKESMADHVRAMLGFKNSGAVVFDYGNGIRQYASEKGVSNAFDIKGFVLEYVRPLFCQGRGPFRWAALSGDPEDIFRIDEVILREFPKDSVLINWIKLARKHLDFDKLPGLPARVCWLGYGDRAKLGLFMNAMVRRGEIKAPIVIGRDHLDCGSVASPLRETEGMRDGSDVVADWPILNGLLNAVSGASWVSVHDGGGVGHGKSIHAGQVVVADGTSDMDIRLERVLNNDPGSGIARHVDAGYEEAMRTAREKGVVIPLLDS
ncbi:MAG: urocanate hydratase [Gemmatimonadota bacterium]|nr:MAG: urocanate hydratase [Gemmatimonadota bacterium]